MFLYVLYIIAIYSVSTVPKHTKTSISPLHILL